MTWRCGSYFNHFDEFLKRIGIRINKSSTWGGMENLCYSANVVVMPMGSDHELDLRSHIDTNRSQVVKRDRLSGLSIDARVDYYPVAVSNMN